MLHGRRKGKKLRSFQASLIDDLLPKLAIDMQSAPVAPARLFSFPPQEIWLEIGFGGGEHLAHEAIRQPGIGFLGCEPFINGAAKLLSIIHEKQLGNIRLHAGDAGELMEQLAPNSVDCIYLLYPDPWPKRRQRKRRFVSDEMLIKLARALRQGGQLRFATDIDDYAGWTLARILRSPDFTWEPLDANWTMPWADWPGTRYEDKAIAAGRPRVYLTFVRR